MSGFQLTIPGPTSALGTGRSAPVYGKISVPAPSLPITPTGDPRTNKDGGIDKNNINLGNLIAQVNTLLKMVNGATISGSGVCNDDGSITITVTLNWG